MKTKTKPAFAKGFDKYAIIGESISATFDGFDVKATIYEDSDSGTPWDREDGHGPVSEWTTRDKAPGERVLCENGRSRRYYDFAAAVATAKADGWGFKDATGTPAEIAAAAAERDYQALKGWCADEWRYIGIVVSVARKGVVLDSHAASLWGIELNYPGSDNEYLAEVANELLGEALDVARATLAKLCDCK